MKFVYGDDSAPILENRVQGTQALSGTGGLRVFGELMKKHGHKHIYVPNPTWGNHIPIFTNSGLEVRKYRYYDSENSDLDFAGLMEDIKSMPEGSIILLHACKFLVLICVIVKLRLLQLVMNTDHCFSVEFF